jgi:hypothetical protein
MGLGDIVRRPSGRLMMHLVPQGLMGKDFFEIMKAVFGTSVLDGAHKETRHEFEDAGFRPPFGRNKGRQTGEEFLLHMPVAVPHGSVCA